MDPLDEHRKKHYVARLKLELHDGGIGIRYTSMPMPYYYMQLFAMTCAAGELFMGYRVVSLILEEVTKIAQVMN